MHLGFIVNRSSMMDASWTTVHLIAAALKMGHEVSVINREDIAIQSDGHASARVWYFCDSETDSEDVASYLQSRQGVRKTIKIRALDTLFLRTKPLRPFLLSVCDYAKTHGVAVVNDPEALMKTNSKAWLAMCPDVHTPPTLITSSPAEAELFFQKQRAGVVLKPNAGSGGQEVHLIPYGNYQKMHQTFSSLLKKGFQQIVVQKNIGTKEQLEKRILWLDGAIIGGYQRRRVRGEFRHNMHQGAIAEGLVITDREKQLVAPLSAHLTRAGIRFAGIDVLGGYILEVNVLNPGGTFHADRLNETSLAQIVMENLNSRSN